MDAREFLIKCLANENIPSLARVLHVRSDQIYDWLRGVHRINPKIARRLGRHFKVGPENFLDLWYTTKGDTFGAGLRRWRLRMGLSLVDLSIRLGYSEKMICNWENNYPLTQEKKDEIRELFESIESNLVENF